MDPKFVPLLYLCSMSGVVMVVGGMLLIYKEKIYIDRESKQITEIETPIGKFKTNIPALVLFVLGFVPLTYPLLKVREFGQKFSISGKVEGAPNSFPVQVYAVAQLDSLPETGEFSLEVPATADQYRVLYVAGRAILQETASARQANKDGVIRLKPKDIRTEAAVRYEPKVQPVPEGF